jgi:hypothetical protein
VGRGWRGGGGGVAEGPICTLSEGPSPWLSPGNSMMSFVWPRLLSFSVKLRTLCCVEEL